MEFSIKDGFIFLCSEIFHFRKTSFPVTRTRIFSTDWTLHAVHQTLLLLSMDKWETYLEPSLFSKSSILDIGMGSKYDSTNSKPWSNRA